MYRIDANISKQKNTFPIVGLPPTGAVPNKQTWKIFPLFGVSYYFRYRCCVKPKIALRLMVIVMVKLTIHPWWSAEVSQHEPMYVLDFDDDDVINYEFVGGYNNSNPAFVGCLMNL